ncbi:hypothetical protein [Methanobacterium ferruginis]|uniref:hypothetical protein n=1 Tax=Methanobacterium ferruginis TaxID=710191 RepID=UPI002573BD44|nr:hypothetical protein [Methanobacterium ferruginis]BDZ67232.1 hypothetical protein GCM10025860_06800 [Methanobacterium ferruginis]
MNENGKDKSSKNIYKMGLMGFVLVTLCAIMSIRNFPSMALVQWQLIAFSILAIILYLIPASLTSAELATGWPKTGEFICGLRKLLVKDGDSLQCGYNGFR